MDKRKAVYWHQITCSGCYKTYKESKKGLVARRGKSQCPHCKRSNTIKEFVLKFLKKK